MKKFLLFIIVFFVGCSNQPNLPTNFKPKTYEQQYQELLKYARRGFPKESYKLARMIYLNKVTKPPFVERKYALYAYNHGFKDASIIIADSYFREKNYQKALLWYQKTPFEIFKDSDFKNYLFIISTLKNPNLQINLLSKLEKYALKSKNPKLLTALGKFYLQDNYFYNPQKAIQFLSKAYYDLNYYPAGVELGIFYIKNNSPEGYKILKKVANIDSRASIYLGDYLYNLMIKQEKLLNSGCITVNFNTPKEFFYKKLSIYKFNKIFTIANVIKAYKHAYKLGNKKGLYKLIKLDIEDNTFELNKHTYSGFDLNQTVSFLSSQNDIESKLILAKIYEKYLYLNSYQKAKKIYQWYKKIDKIQALWHLYQYEKRFENKIDFNYLDYLTAHKFVPAIIEKAYQEIILNKNIYKNRKILEYYAKQKNILALNYLGSLYSRAIFLPKNKSIEYFKLACILEKKPFYIPSEDLKIANYYLTLNNQIKHMSINYYYAQMLNRQAELTTAKFYKSNCNYLKMKKWANFLKKQKDLKGINYYYSLVLNGTIYGNYKKALDYYKYKNDPQSLILLGDFYSNGYYNDLNITKAIYYYKKAYAKGANIAVLKEALMYEKINVNGIYDKKIENLLKQAVKLNLPDAYILLAQFHLKNNQSKKAIQTIKSMPNYIHNPKALYIIYQITGRLINTQGNTNYGYLLYAKSLEYGPKNPQKALYYAFRAMLCNTPNSSLEALKLIKIINDKKIIEEIYKRAKKAPKCYL
ncbi:hypothetical protein [Caminibacter sp.]